MRRPKRPRKHRRRPIRIKVGGNSAYLHRSHLQLVVAATAVLERHFQCRKDGTICPQPIGRCVPLYDEYGSAHYAVSIPTGSVPRLVCWLESEGYECTFEFEDVVNPVVWEATLPTYMGSCPVSCMIPGFPGRNFLVPSRRTISKVTFQILECNPRFRIAILVLTQAQKRQWNRLLASRRTRPSGFVGSSNESTLVVLPSEFDEAEFDLVIVPDADILRRSQHWIERSKMLRVQRVVFQTGRESFSEAESRLIESVAGPRQEIFCPRVPNGAPQVVWLSPPSHCTLLKQSPRPRRFQTATDGGWNRYIATIADAVGRWDYPALIELGAPERRPIWPWGLRMKKLSIIVVTESVPQTEFLATLLSRWRPITSLDPETLELEALRADRHAPPSSNGVGGLRIIASSMVAKEISSVICPFVLINANPHSSGWPLRMILGDCRETLAPWLLDVAIPVGPTRRDRFLLRKRLYESLHWKQWDRS